jgi:hypothetical protein
VSILLKVSVVELFLNLTATGFELIAISSNKFSALNNAEPVVLSVGTPYLTFLIFNLVF